MLQISPQKLLPLVWHGADPNDTDTLYVRAVVKDAITLATLDTVDLTDNGSHLFTGTATAPHDPSQTGTGRWIIVTYTVYTDSGYTTASLNYQRITEQYLVKTLVDATMNFGGGATLDEKMIEKILGRALEAHKLEPVKFPDIPKLDLDTFRKDLLSEVKKIVEQTVGGIPTPEKPEKVDLSSLDAGIRKAIQDINSRPKFEKTDLSELILSINRYMNEMKEMHEDNKEEMLKYFNKFKEEIIDSISEDNAKMKLIDAIKMGKVGFEMLDNPEAKKKKGYLKTLASKYINE